MSLLVRFLIFSIPLSIFSLTVEGLEFYPAFFLAPLGFMELIYALRGDRPQMIKYGSFGVALLALMILVHSTGKFFLIKDLLKLITFILLYKALQFADLRMNIKVERILDKAIVVLVIFGLFQIGLALAGQRAIANYLHNTLAPDSYGAIDSRGFGFGSTYRVASLTLEPSYFAFIVSCYLLLSDKRWMKVICSIGIFISFSLITIYGWLGLAGYKIWKIFRLPTTLFLISTLIVHFIFVATIYDQVPKLLFPTFLDRYAGFVEFLKSFGWMEVLFGSLYVDMTYPINLIRPYSNLGSITFLYGLVGFALYVYLFRVLEIQARKPLVIIMVFLMMFNYYYLTSWPIIAALFYLALKPKPVVVPKET